MSNTLSTLSIESDLPLSDAIPDSQLLFLSEVVERVEDIVMPVWPLKDYVAVNPHWKWIGHAFIDTHRQLQAVSSFDLLPSLAAFSEQYQRGQISLACVRSAISESSWQAHFESAEETELYILGRLNGEAVSDQDDFLETALLTPFAQLLRDRTGRDWPDMISQEVGRFCGSYFDQGQAQWTVRRTGNLFLDWQDYASTNRTPELLGLRGFRSRVRQLPQDPKVSILQQLHAMRVPQRCWEVYLRCLVYSLPGWFAYTRYLAESHADQERPSEFLELIAICLTFEAALADQFEAEPNWNAITVQSDQPLELDEEPSKDICVRSILLRASELSWEQSLVSEILEGQSPGSTKAAEAEAARPTRSLAQMVFCIDVRSERLRRNLEQCDAGIETFGFAGFFGVPMQILPFGSSQPTNQLPVLLQPQFQVIEEPTSQAESADRLLQGKTTARALRAACKQFATMAVSCFTFVESLGCWFAAALAKRSLVGIAGKSKRGPFRLQKPELDGLPDNARDLLAPTLRGLNRQGITTSRQVELAAGILKNLGLTDGFSRLVVLCGHESQTDNNPLAASLDCGACGGHSGAANARFAATLLNQPYVRQGLCERGLEIPADTQFLAAIHNTTTDSIDFLDTSALPETHGPDLRELSEHTRRASCQTRLERSPLLQAAGEADLLRRAIDWSEVRPEWGLAGNAAFIVGPRSVTSAVDLQGRAFLHSYDYRQDQDGSVLELIMTAPMVVAHWINMQYYVSAVDPKNFGSGSKTLHNVVGKFGLLSGAGGDLMTGLPWESLHTGSQFQHQPLRLLSVIAAPRVYIDRILEKHQFLQDLIQNQWIHLIALEDGSPYRCRAQGAWERWRSHQASTTNMELNTSAVPATGA